MCSSERKFTVIVFFEAESRAEPACSFSACFVAGTIWTLRMMAVSLTLLAVCATDLDFAYSIAAAVARYDAIRSCRHERVRFAYEKPSVLYFEIVVLRRHHAFVRFSSFSFVIASPCCCSSFEFFKFGIANGCDERFRRCCGVGAADRFKFGRGHTATTHSEPQTGPSLVSRCSTRSHCKVDTVSSIFELSASSSP